MDKSIKNELFIKICIIIVLVMLVILAYMFTGVGTRPDYVIPRRFRSLLVMTLVSICIAYSSIIFQTITNNRILTPGVIGFESIYMFIQTFIVYKLGSGSYFITGNTNFIISVIAMMFFSILLFKFMFKRENQNIYFLLLVGMIMGTMFSSLTSFMQMVMDPSEFLIVQNNMFASFSTVNLSLLRISLVLVIITILYSLNLFKYLDVLSLGKETAIGLGVNHASISKQFLIVIAILVSVSTALVGPITFLGVLVSNLTYEFVKTYKHLYIIPICICITIICVVGGQYLVSLVFNFSTTLSVLVNFIGGIYFMHLLLKENRSW